MAVSGLLVLTYYHSLRGPCRASVQVPAARFCCVAQPWVRGRCRAISHPVLSVTHADMRGIGDVFFSPSIPR